MSRQDTTAGHLRTDVVVFFILPVFLLLIHGAIPSWVEALAWIVLIGLLIVRAGPALRRAMGMLLILSLYAALLLSAQGVETVRTLNEMSSGSRLLATLGWVIATAAFAFALTDTTRALLRRSGSDRRRSGGDREASSDDLLTRLMFAGPFLFAFVALMLSHGNGLVGLFDDSIAGFLKALFGMNRFPTLWSFLTFVAWVIVLFLGAGLLFVREIDLNWFDEHIPLNKRLNLSNWSMGLACFLFFLWIVICILPVWTGPLSVPAPAFFAGWFAVVIVAVATLRALIQWAVVDWWGANKLSQKPVVAPIVTLLVAWAIVLTALDLNDNHELAYRRESSWRPAPLATDAFSAWLESQRKKFGPQPAVPTVFIVTAEGGGARAAYMTALTLEVLRQHCQKFAQWHFATIGVSGGSVGAALSAASEATPRGDCKLPEEIDPNSYIPAKVAGTDFLDPSLRALLLSDLALRLWPGSAWRSNGHDGQYQVANSPLDLMRDRGQNIERTLSDAWQHAGGGSNPLGEQSFNNYSPFPLEKGGNRPALILLTTDVASGHRIAFSHLRFRDGVSQPPVSTFSQMILPPPPCRSPADEARAAPALRARLLTFNDIAPGRETTLLAAAVASARFPIISSAATLPCSEPRWRVVDGGYFENSGLTTALELINHVIQGASAAKRKVRVALVRIENGEATTSNSDRADRPPGENGPTASDLWAPVQTFMATRDARAENARSIIDRAADKNIQKYCPSGATDCVDFEQFIIKLERCNIPVPLGWSLSATARADIARQLGLIKTRPEDVAWWNEKKCMDSIAPKNREKLEDIMKRAAQR